MSGIDTIKAVANMKAVQIALAAVGSSAVTGAIVYKVLSVKLETKYADLADREIAEAREKYKVTIKEPLEVPEDLEPISEEEVNEYSDKANELGYTSVQAHPALVPVIDDNTQEAATLIEAGEELAERLESAVETVEEVIGRPKTPLNNVFKDARSANSEFDYEAEKQIREGNPGIPYIVSHDEFFESDLVHSTLTYFEGDDVLVDEHDDVIPNATELIGDQTVHHFGHGSKDNNVVYVRNETLDCQFEILRSTGTYVKEVLGFDDSDNLQHSEKRGRARRRRAGERE